MQTLSNWQDKASEGKLKSTKEYDPQLMAIIKEKKCSSWGLKVAKDEHEVLKKATACFAKDSSWSML
ncbi:hypothetical protein ES754_02360 [Psychrobacter frigidicola]|uniref:Transposase n=1 Tax=Psychrobacter frigidicola TaxID=45611 RepID=A0A5C7A412_9GAMM|nr:hypothetical protein ES754_02360 [Psychrobacter frigidicola]